MIRVFPRRTKWTPTDELSFVGDPPLWRPIEQPVRVSCTFTWDRPEAERLVRSWSRFYSDVQVGGPAFDDPGGEFVPGRFVKAGVTITSRGCIRSCGFCLVPQREGKLRELPIRDGWDVADNNLLACSKQHITSVFEMLRRQPQPIHFSGGLDARLFDDWHADLLRSVRLHVAYFACDSQAGLPHLEQVAKRIDDISREKKRCYVLIGYNGETIQEAKERLKAVYHLDFLPFAMLYRAPSGGAWAYEWRQLQKTWARPAAFKAKMRGATQ